jgi:hypothetical protein
MKTSPILPFEIIVIVAECLAGGGDFGTLAAFSATCSTVRQSVVPVLCETAVVSYEMMEKWNQEGYAMPSFFEKHGKYTKYVVIRIDLPMLTLKDEQRTYPSSRHLVLFGDPIQPVALQSLFPNRCATIIRNIEEIKDDHSNTKKYERVSLCIERTITVSSLRDLLHVSARCRALVSPDGDNLDSMLTWIGISEEGRIVGSHDEQQDAVWTHYRCSFGTRWLLLDNEKTQCRLDTMVYLWKATLYNVKNSEVVYLDIVLVGTIQGLETSLGAVSRICSH